MSKSDKETQDSGKKPEKTVTKYDLKMQRRKEQKEKERRDKRIGEITGIVLVVALACFVASFPIRNWLTLHGAYIKVNGDSITKVEYDYNYNVAYNGFISEMGYYLYYVFGIDFTQDFSSQMYSDTMTWGDYFDQLTVERISQNKGLVAQAEAEGFTYDATDDYNKYTEELKAAASEAGTTEKAFIQNLYGVYATESRLKPYIIEALYAQAYAEVITERMTPTQEEIQEYYDNHKQDYDSVDYYLLTVSAQLPTEPTELADPVEGEGAAGGEGTASGEGAADGETEEPYQPSEAEIEAAMKEAKAEAEKSESAVETSGELFTGGKYANVTSYIRDWLFAEERTAGETTIIENTNANSYYVVKFVSRTLDQTPSIDYRMVVTEDGNAQEIFDEWKNGAATEDSFAEICDKYNDSSANEGGLVEGRLISELSDGELKDWLFGEGRAAGDTAVIAQEGEERAYVVYYLGLDDPEWILEIRNTVLSDKVDAYVEEILADVTVDDPKGNLRFIEILKEEETQQSGEEGAEDAGTGTEGSSEDASGSAEG